MEWVEAHDKGSVVYVCFGSCTFLTSSQIEVLARALELSGVNIITILESDSHTTALYPLFQANCKPLAIACSSRFKLVVVPQLPENPISQAPS